MEARTCESPARPALLKVSQSANTSGFTRVMLLSSADLRPTLPLVAGKQQLVVDSNQTSREVHFQVGGIFS